MTRVLAALFGFMGSLAGRIALILAVGTSLASLGALFVAEVGRHNEFDRVQGERVIASAADVLTRMDRDPSGTETSLRNGQLIGANLISATSVPHTGIDATLTPLLAARVDPALHPTIAHVPATVCQRSNGFWRRPHAAGFGMPVLTDCWLLSMDQGSRQIAVAIDLPRLPPPPSRTTDPVFLFLLVCAAVVLSLIVARLATAPLRRLSTAADAFARSIDAEPVAERGPADVRSALATFNVMQERVRAGLRERTRILAAIAHDLQTPLTRLRLRLEQVEDAALRERLIADLSATLAMVRRGLDLARSGESAEDWSTVDLDSLLSSIADDAAEFGHAVVFSQGCTAMVRVRPDALTRCLTNLVDNAIKYGGDADIGCRREGRCVVVTVRDHGPGMTDAMLARAFDPFVRGDSAGASGDGSGIGLTIARAQAMAIGARLALANHPAGGVEAMLTLDAISR